MGFSLPAAPADGYDSSSSQTSAEIMIDQQYGLRMLNLSLAGPSTVGLSDLASRLGFRWSSSSEGSDVLSFGHPRVYYASKKVGAPVLVRDNRTLAAPELGVAALITLPALGLDGEDGVLRIQPGGRLSIQVGWLAGRAVRQPELEAGQCIACSMG
jgi:hypothetical protein